MIKILIADDSEDIRNGVAWYLRREGFEVFTAADGDEALEVETTHSPDLLILDIMMPGMSGLDIAKTLTRNVPIIFLTALGEENDRLTGFNLGADDYITKPFSPRELVARARVVLRRTGKLALTGDVLQFGSLSLEPGTQRVIYNGESTELSTKEFELLYFLAKNNHTIFTREKLLVNIWGYDYNGDDRVVDTTISRMRKKIGAAGDYIETIRGKGYKFEVNKP
ncbi:transcriptional regulatory protein c terminal [Lucifera butyrica]|uniref:Transcriptional regulatory protein c terminal n=1 Tax=Lucifera butyrica TaxID=1351585 RepID=A0A498R713_9FIRM|nr:response regulator transcription factor [Lucifera butyrica]VBB08526.1 transcriptional regulatory protein c terminal [Lucifera butyrica]